MSFPTRFEAGVERNQRPVPTVGGREGCGEQRAAQAASTTGNAPLSLALSAVVVEGSKTGKRCSFFAANLPKFGHADQKRQRRAFANAGNAEHQIKPLGKIVVGPKALGNVAYLGRLACLQPGDIAVNNAPQA